MTVATDAFVRDLTERRPRGSGWQRVEAPATMDRGPGVHGVSAWTYGRITVTSTLADMELPGGCEGVGLTWLVSVSRGGKARASDSDVRKVRRCFGMLEAEEDNHHPGVARHLFLVVNPAHRVACDCKTDETVVEERDGYRYSQPVKGECVGCALDRELRAKGLPGRPCATHAAP